MMIARGIAETHRKEMHDFADRSADELEAKLMSMIGAMGHTAEDTAASIKIPTFEQCQDPANKNGANLTERGVEVLYRLFDMGAGYNRASKALNITQTAARHRKGAWEKAGGLHRVRQPLPGIDD
ncbi:hypothetical protein [Brevundimonas sp. S30B]|uniref:hypothetical protein n=1 Tax=Brevundimonas sp. S30B TaxID=2561925 RepID=UPI001AE6BF06|nr:hypothetical protein [Brevundimonas sp. S30B]